MKRTVVKCLLGVWLCVSVIAIVGMYSSLWWTRDRVLYGGKPDSEKRATVFQRLGFNPSILADVQTLVALWPVDIHYSIKGAGDCKYYVKYLLAPRIPSGDESHQVIVNNDTFSAVYPEYQRGQIHTFDKPWRYGWVLSLLLVAGLGHLLGRSMRGAGLSFPEMTALAVFLVSIAVVLSKAFTGSAAPGMLLVALLGTLGALYFVLNVTPSSVLRLWKGRILWIGSKKTHLVPRHLWWVTLWGIMLSAVLLSLLLSVAVVLDDCDSWIIWGPKAKVLALGRGPLADVTYFTFSDYPLMWPGLWGFSAWLCGGWEEQWCRAWGAVFLALTAWQIGNVVISRCGRRDLGVLSGALFLSIPKVIVISSWSYAEAPLWLFTISAFGRLLSSRDSNESWHPILAGCFAAGAAWTKNEGMLFAILGGIWLLFFGRQRWRQTLLYISPLLVCMLPWLLWTRFTLHLELDSMKRFVLTSGRLHYALDRLVPGLAKAGEIWLDFKQWGIVLGGLCLSAVYVIWRGSPSQRIALSLPLLIMFGMFTVLLFYRGDLYWQIGSSWDRLTAQTLPLFIVAVITGMFDHFTDS